MRIQTCMFTHTCIHTNTHTYKMYIFTHEKCTHTHIHTKYTHTNMQIHTYVFMSRYVYVCTCRCVCVTLFISAVFLCHHCFNFQPMKNECRNLLLPPGFRCSSPRAAARQAPLIKTPFHSKQHFQFKNTSANLSKRY